MGIMNSNMILNCCTFIRRIEANNSEFYFGILYNLDLIIHLNFILFSILLNPIFTF